MACTRRAACGRVMGRPPRLLIMPHHAAGASAAAQAFHAAGAANAAAAAAAGPPVRDEVDGVQPVRTRGPAAVARQTVAADSAAPGGDGQGRAITDEDAHAVLDFVYETHPFKGITSARGGGGCAGCRRCRCQAPPPGDPPPSFQRTTLHSLPPRLRGQPRPAGEHVWAVLRDRRTRRQAQGGRQVREERFASVVVPRPSRLSNAARNRRTRLNVRLPNCNSAAEAAVTWDLSQVWRRMVVSAQPRPVRYAAL